MTYSKTDDERRYDTLLQMLKTKPKLLVSKAKSNAQKPKKKLLSPNEERNNS